MTGGTRTTTSSLAARLTAFTVEMLEALERHHLPGWQLPRTFAGHAVGADVRADVCFTLTHLADAGTTDFSALEFTLDDESVRRTRDLLTSLV